MGRGVRLLATCLAGLVLVTSHRVKAVDDAPALFQANCAACHQADGSGVVGLAPPLRSSDFQKLSRDSDYLPRVLLTGMTGKIMVDGMALVGNMPSFATQFSDQEIAGLVTLLRIWQPNAAGDQAATASDDLIKQVSLIRAQSPSPSQTYALRGKILASP